ncbi:hypothetical protein JOD45_002380 [Scopulibacillus daqui]|uniref:Uncharacterized protein n=1 Tax=Scopulibacillus daqui TaxID=1469162 RepID=A0ABS2Q1I1_9BACL|nr:hypothetical protein [Scopulibacillus daqui]
MSSFLIVYIVCAIIIIVGLNVMLRRQWNNRQSKK